MPTALELEVLESLRAEMAAQRARKALCHHPVVTVTPDVSPLSQWAMSQPIDAPYGRRHDVVCCHCQTHWQEIR